MWIYYSSGVLVVAAVIYLFLIFPVKPQKADYQKFSGHSYAHRGFHDNEAGPSENTSEAFVLAGQHNYGIELDVQLTKDKKVVVFHDADLKRSSGIDRRVLDIEYEELKEIQVFGTGRIPLFSEVLELTEKGLPIIVEIKSEGGREWVNETCLLAYGLLKDYTGLYCVESFDPVAVGWFKKNAPHVVRGQLSMSRKKYEGAVKPLPAFLLQNLMLNFVSRPHFIAYDHEDNCLSLKLSKVFKAMIIRWTVKNQKRQDELQSESDGIIFEGYTPEPVWKHR